MLRSLVSLAMALAIIFPASASFADKPEFTLKTATVAPPNTPWSELLKRYKKTVKKGSEKRIKVKVYLGGTKGDELSIVRQVQKGGLQGAGVSTGAMSAIVTEMDIMELPYLFDSFEEADRVLDAVRPIIIEILEAKGFKLIMYSENGYRCFGSNKPIKTPADMKAMKMRSQESPVHLNTYRALGASPVSISVGEVLSSLKTGVVDGFDNTPLFSQAASWHQAIKHFTVSEHIYQPALLILNKKWYDGLPPDLQTAVLPTNRKLEKQGRKAIRALNGPLLENLRNQNIEVHTLTDAEKDAFRKATAPVWAKRRAAATPLGKKLYDAIMAEKAKQ
jgi:tripartite ATP-independent transporter DctP family solute receptor